MPRFKEQENLVQVLGADLTKELQLSSKDTSQQDAAVPSIDRCSDILSQLEKCSMTIALLEATMIGKVLTKSIKSFRRHKRNSSIAPQEAKQFQTLLERSERLLATWKKSAEQESKGHNKEEEGEDANDTSGGSASGLPSSTSVYRARLVQQKKEMYKDPPTMPPPFIVVEETRNPLPKRNNKTGELTFIRGQNEETNNLLKDFHPNRTPEEVMRAGSFGGTYFRPIVSAVTNMRYRSDSVLRDTVDPNWIKGISKSTMLTSPTYRNQINKYKVKCGGSLGMWESSGWITSIDPYGWFQWYCRFYQGRRTSDDARQISRWLKSAGPKGRFRSQLCNKCLAASTDAEDVAISPVIRQTLLHWGFELTPELLRKHEKRVKG